MILLLLGLLSWSMVPYTRGNRVPTLIHPSRTPRRDSVDATFTVYNHLTILVSYFGKRVEDRSSFSIIFFF